MKNHVKPGLTLGVALAGAMALTGQATAQNTAVTLELSLVVDVSSSVNSTEFDLQREGYAAAFEDQAIIDAIAGLDNGLAINMVQFSSTAAEVIPFTLLTDASSSQAFADAIRNTGRASLGGLTGIGEGIAVGAESLASNSFDGDTVIIDISGDGTLNTGRSIADAHAVADNSGVDQINGLPISLSQFDTLPDYYENEVIRGDGSFIIVADSFAAVGDALAQKLSVEIAIADPDVTPDPPTHVIPTPSAAAAGVILLGGLLARRRRDDDA